MIGIIKIQILLTGIACHRLQVFWPQCHLLHTTMDKKVFHEFGQKVESLQPMENDPYGMQREIGYADAV